MSCHLRFNILLIGGTVDEVLPGFVGFKNNIGGVLLVLSFTGESELVLWLAVWDLVDSEPFVGGTEKTWKVTLDVFDVVDL